MFINLQFSFSNFKSKGAVQDVRNRLEGKGLFPYEIAALANLCPDSVNLARAYIPSIDLPERNIDDDDLKQLIDEMMLCQQFQY